MCDGLRNFTLKNTSKSKYVSLEYDSQCLVQNNALLSNIMFNYLLLLQEISRKCFIYTGTQIWQEYDSELLMQ